MSRTFNEQHFDTIEELQENPVTFNETFTKLSPFSKNIISNLEELTDSLSIEKNDSYYYYLFKIDSGKKDQSITHMVALLYIKAFVQLEMLNKNSFDEEEFWENLKSTSMKQVNNFLKKEQKNNGKKA